MNSVDVLLHLIHFTAKLLVALLQAGHFRAYNMYLCMIQNLTCGTVSTQITSHDYMYTYLAIVYLLDYSYTLYSHTMYTAPCVRKHYYTPCVYQAHQSVSLAHALIQFPLAPSKAGPPDASGPLAPSSNPEILSIFPLALLLSPS